MSTAPAESGEDQERSTARTTDVEESPSREAGRQLCYAVFVAAIRAAITSSCPTEEEISRRVGRRKDYLTKALANPETLTIRSVGSILWACGVEVDDVRFMAATGGGIRTQAGQYDAPVPEQSGHAGSPSCAPMRPERAPVLAVDPSWSTPPAAALTPIAAPPTEQADGN